MARRRYQVGSLYLKGESWIGRWREDVILGGKVLRVRRARAIGTKTELPTRKLALRRLESLLAKVNAPSYRPGRVASLAEFVNRWRTDFLSQRKPSTARAAESHLRGYILPALGTYRLEEITTEVQQAFLAKLAVKLRRKTVLNIMGTLSSMLGTAKRWGYLCEAVDFKALALPTAAERVQARFFTAEEARQVTAEAAEPFATIFLVAATTAMRPGELLGLKVEDLDFQRQVIFVRRSAWYGKLQAPKSKSSIRALPMPDLLVARLKAYLQSWRPNPAGLLFATRSGTPLSANNLVQRKLWPILDRLGIPRCGLHAFRHTHSSLLVETGAPISVAQAQLGHSDPRVTLGIYSHVIGDSQRRAVNKVAEILDYSGLPQAGSADSIQ